MRLYNSKTQTAEEFSLRDSEITLYVCSITPYDTTHALKELARGILEAAKGRRDVMEAQEMLRIYSRVFGLTLGSENFDERVVDGWNLKKRSPSPAAQL
jgi:hypothetical protein